EREREREREGERKMAYSPLDLFRPRAALASLSFPRSLERTTSLPDLISSFTLSLSPFLFCSFSISPLFLPSHSLSLSLSLLLSSPYFSSSLLSSLLLSPPYRKRVV